MSTNKQWKETQAVAGNPCWYKDRVLLRLTNSSIAPETVNWALVMSVTFSGKHFPFFMAFLIVQLGMTIFSNG